MKKSIDDYIEMVLYCIIVVICFPFFWLYEKYVFYSEERSRLYGEIEYLKEKLEVAEEQREEYRNLYVSGEYWQSECARLRKLLSAHGVTNKQISNKRNRLKYGKAQL